MLEKLLAHFLSQKCRNMPLLLGLSGGPDSMVLFYLLLAQNYPFSVAHIDHGWRKESKDEALFLKKLCQSHQIPFFLKRLSPKSDSSSCLGIKQERVSKNLEDQCRQKRLEFFKETIQNQDRLVGVILGHHGDDQAETVLKRVCEGASLPKLKGLTDCAEWKGLKIFRPFLSESKKTLIKWLEKRNKPYFQDKTNEDQKFLRSRLRHHILPHLSKEFGKEVSKSLCRIGKNAAEFEEFLNELLLPFRQKIVIKDEDVFIDLKEGGPKNPFLWKAVVKDFFNSQGLTLSNFLLETIVDHLQKSTKKIEMRIEKRRLTIHKCALSISKNNVFN